MPDLTPPSAALLPPTSVLRERLAVALREVDLLRRLIRAAESVQPAEAYRCNEAQNGRESEPVPE